MRVLVCGGRDFTNYIKLNKALDDLGYWDDMVSRCRKHNILVHIYEEESN